MFTAKLNLLKFLKMKNLKNLGQALSKAEQKTINGGGNRETCKTKICLPGEVCLTRFNGVGVCVPSPLL